MIDINKDVVNPFSVVDEANLSATPQARLLNNPYLSAAVIAYDHHRFLHSHILNVLYPVLLDLAHYRWRDGKRTTRDFLIQEALRIGEMLDTETFSEPPTPLEVYRFSIRANKLTNKQLYGFD